MLALLAALGLAAPAQAAEHRLMLGATLPYGVQPGARVAWRRGLRGWDGRRARVAWTAGADVAGYVRPANHASLWLDGATGLRWTRAANGRFRGVELGLATAFDRQTESLSVDLGSGETTATRTWRAHVVPTSTGRLGRTWDRGLGWFASASVGPELAVGRPNSLFFALDAGLVVRLGRSP